jgi:hypothetical protein
VLALLIAAVALIGGAALVAVHATHRDSDGSRASPAGHGKTRTSKSVTMHAAVSEGAEFRWKAGPGTITSVLEQVEGRAGWGGAARASA